MAPEYQHTPACAWYEQTAVQQAGEIMDLRALLASREADIAWRDEIIRAALHALQQLTRQRDRQREIISMLREELRRLPPPTQRAA